MSYDWCKNIQVGVKGSTRCITTFLLCSYNNVLTRNSSLFVLTSSWVSCLTPGLLQWHWVGEISFGYKNQA